MSEKQGENIFVLNHNSVDNNIYRNKHTKKHLIKHITKKKTIDDFIQYYP